MIAGILRRLFGPGTPVPGLGGYRFQDFAARFHDRVRAWPRATSARPGARAGIVVTPWLCTATPFFTLECALEPVLLWDRANVFCNAAKSSEVACVGEDVFAARFAPSERTREDATLVYYLIEERLANRTNFTPQPPDFQHWIERAPDELWADPAQTLLRDALISRETVPWLQHTRDFSKPGARGVP